MNDYNSIKKDLFNNLKRYNLGKFDKKTVEIYTQYLKNCIYFQQYVIGNLDTFKKSACVMEAILKCKIAEEEQENDMIAVDISFSLIENPSYYLGENYDQEFPLNPISINKIRKNSYLWDNHLDSTLKSIQFQREERKKRPLTSKDLKEIDIISMADNLELFYQATLLTQNPMEYYQLPITAEEERKNLHKQKQKVKSNFQ